MQDKGSGLLGSATRIYLKCLPYQKSRTTTIKTKGSALIKATADDAARYSVIVRAVTNSTCATQDCSLSVYGAFTGNDKNGVSFTTGLDISRINAYALSGYFDDAKQEVCCPYLHHF